MVVMLLKQRARKGGGREMDFNSGSKLVKFSELMVVTDGLAGSFPDVLLGIEVRGRGRELDNLEPGMSVEHLLDGRAAMPGSFIPEEQDRLVRIGEQELLQEQGRGLSRHDRSAQDNLSTGGQIESAVEMG